MTKHRLTILLAAMAIVSLCACASTGLTAVQSVDATTAATQYSQMRADLQATTDVSPDVVAARALEMRGKIVEIAGEIVGRTTHDADSPSPLSIVIRPDKTDASVFVDAPQDYPAIEVGNSVHVLLELPAQAHPLDHYVLRAIVLTDHLPLEQRNSAVRPATRSEPTERKQGNAIKPGPLADLPSGGATGQTSQELGQSAVARPGSEFPSNEQWGTTEAVNAWSAWVSKRNSRLSDLQARLIAECVLYYSQKYRIDHRLAFAMIRYESDFNPSCRSHAGAMGLTQLMPGTARSVGVSDPWDIRQNIMGGIRYLAAQLYKYEGRSNYEQTILGLACYNAGPNAVKRAGGVPNYAETQRYVKRVTDLFRQLWEDGMP